ncbi:Gfo/Idh/MocA family protein [Pediococcus claussenii]|uniref:Oxidoreductase, NAD-binding Rossmann fold family protein n=1 Tax=Pediococcus claussenii (strain ATCC BAA-344 / DSM 14800 / JCM 18046 / KCTC 3811 / LMG 21948 / P06) TaxID=701521 RepID=G8PC49_PEDCP|nr:Gfo/Idh/MocA family oxidoreductase [Pediococcus claussenii]AEV94868.1 oxidoreductase, NAD-binding Rossmann fold family protein [Pediococcus claussenii ATCC BAA-344]ANZ70064.1 hypothetical protein AYR57_06920 [Pediococcus claussenii]ANZ71879.1 hypothetical protein AYR58_06920 [Pediococcus claussenii]KRN21046.1 hypothetical protein IV79_GL000272 [Pediococcus claussenii]
MKKIGVIGLGTIAQKAYLPVFADLRENYDWVLTTRDGEKLSSLALKYGFKKGFQSIGELLKSGIDAIFIHTPTATHYDIIKKCLNAGIDVYVDKPISENLDEVTEMYNLAESKGLLLTCGFNRRFIPFNKQIRLDTNRRVEVVKNRIGEQQDVNYAIFDLLLHCVDTAIFEMGTSKAIYESGLIQAKDQKLVSAEVVMRDGFKVGRAVIDMQAGANRETVQVVNEKGIMQVKDCRQLDIIADASDQTFMAPDWESNLITRGFQPLILDFLKALDTRNNPVPPETAILSHKICTDLISRAKVLK